MTNKASHGALAPCTHCGDPVVIGGNTIWAGGENYFQSGDLDQFTGEVRLRDERIDRSVPFGHWEGGILSLPIRDFRTVENRDWGTWRQRLVEVREHIRRPGTKLVVYCAGGHGRTGLFLASLLALMEPECDDPVTEIRNRYCHHAVETLPQKAQVMRLLREVRAVNRATFGA